MKLLNHRPLIIPVALLALLGMALVIASALRPRPVPLIPVRTGQPEYCLTCHQGIEPMSAAHPTEDFGCVSCHAGQPQALEAEVAHTGMVRNPAALDTARQFCGECHSAQIALVERSLQATYAGAISMVRRTFGLQPDSTAQYAIRQVGHLQAFAPAESDPAPLHQFAANCLDCHLYSQPKQADYFYRSDGCSACHVLYAEDGLYQGDDPTVPKDEAGHPQKHQFTTAIPYTQCNHCHNRGNYDLRTMTFLLRPDMPAPEPLTGAAKRVHDYYQPIGEFTRCEWELDCVDCHTSLEVMGDGVLHNNRSESQYIQCATCHGTLDARPVTQMIQSEDGVAMTRARLNPFVELSPGDTILATGRGEPLYHIRQHGDRWVLTGKATGEQYELPLVTGTACQQKSDEQASRYCHQCHAFDREGPLP